MFFFGSYMGKDNPALGQPKFGGHGSDICFSGCRKSQQPEVTVLYPLEDVYPHLESGWVNLVELVEVTENDAILR